MKFSLRTLIVATAIFCFFMAWVGRAMKDEVTFLMLILTLIVVVPYTVIRFLPE